ncbi:hypothetical protein HHK36_030880 [Tetracentron sinense]|uniref:LOB domain-containing protein n=1 Tax=Tetracentron sinense TaxID=13715 RepID=A0A834YDJ0_TETSI|nr:hypothetical protein HHK36_030880 [Tetracentron sinense]
MAAAPSSNSVPCAACKLGRKICTDGCLFAPYFPQNNQHSLRNFNNLHMVFGAGNVYRLLQCLNPEQRQDTMNSLIYEAEARFLNPVYGCLGIICVLKHRLNQLYHELFLAQGENIGPYVMFPPKTKSVILEPKMLGPQQIAAVVAASEQQELLSFGALLSAVSGNSSVGSLGCENVGLSSQEELVNPKESVIVERIHRLKRGPPPVGSSDVNCESSSLLYGPHNPISCSGEAMQKSTGLFGPHSPSSSCVCAPDFGTSLCDGNDKDDPSSRKSKKKKKNRKKSLMKKYSAVLISNNVGLQSVDEDEEEEPICLNKLLACRSSLPSHCHNSLGPLEPRNHLLRDKMESTCDGGSVEYLLSVDEDEEEEPICLNKLSACRSLLPSRCHNSLGLNEF